VIESRNTLRSEEAARFILPGGRTPVVIRRKRRWLRILAGIALVVAVMVPAYFAAGSTASSISDDHLFSIRKVNVCGVDSSSARSVHDALSALNGKSLWSLSADDVGRAISGFGFVEGFQMKKQYPSEVTIEIRKRDAIGSVRVGSKEFAVDGSGNYWELDSFSGKAPELKGSLPPGDAKLQSLLRQIWEARLEGRISSIAPQEPDAFVLVTKEGREAVVFADDFGTQWSKFLRTEEWIKRNIRAGGRVDLRWSNRVVLIPSGAPQEEVKDNGQA